MRYLLQRSQPFVQLRIRRSVCVVLVGVTVFALPNAAYACSGSGTMSVINGNHVFALKLFAVGCLLVLATEALCSFRRKPSSLIIAGIAASVLAAHPAWTVSAVNADCGMAKAAFAVNATFLLAILFAAQLVLWLFTLLRKRRA